MESPTATVAGELGGAQLVAMYREALLIRRLLERSIAVFEEGLIPGGLHPGVGHEGIVVGAFHALQEQDYITPTHRTCQGFLYLRGVPLRQIWAEMLGRRTGINRGRRGEAQMGALECRVFPGNPVLGHGTAIATGAALALKMKRAEAIHIAFFGDGYSNAGTVFEAFNIAAIYKLPVVFVCENNQYGYSTPFEKTSPVPNVADRAAAFGFPGMGVDGNDVAPVYETIKVAAERARQGEGPSLVECKTYRFVGHFIGDPEVYRRKEEVEQWRQRCPVQRMHDLVLRLELATPEELDRLVASVDAEIEESFAQAQGDPMPEP